MRTESLGPVNSSCLLRFRRQRVTPLPCCVERRRQYDALLDSLGQEQLDRASAPADFLRLAQKHLADRSLPSVGLSRPVGGYV